MLIKKIYRSVLLGLALLTFSQFASSAEVPVEQDIKVQLDALKNDKANEQSNKPIITNLEGTLTILADTEEQKNTNAQLKKQIATAADGIKSSQANIEKLKAQSAVKKNDNLEKFTIAELQTKLATTQQKIQQMQTELADLNSSLSAQKSAPERAQAGLTENLNRTQQINTELAKSGTIPSLRMKYNAELALIGLKDEYNRILLDGNDDLTRLYSSQVEEKNLEQQVLQAQLTALQTAINEKNLQESKSQLEQAARLEEKNADINPILKRELEFNTRISQELLTQTTQLNQLSQDSLRIKNVLDNLQQTQQNINEQISSLQGTLVLSRIINKQRQALPQDTLIKGLSKQIADLRVRIFDITEVRDRAANVESYIADLEKTEKITFTEKERSQLEKILQERSKILTDLLKQLNSQLNLLINIELNQLQVQTISDALQNKLQQQSFWVKSNNQMDLDWFKNLPSALTFQLRDIGKIFDFSNWRDNILGAGITVIFLLALTALIQRRKERIKQKLTNINNQMRTLDSDSQWHTPMAILWTLVLCLPSTLIFLSVFILVTYICFQNPTAVWPWGLKMAGYWLYFAFMLALLRPNGIACRHFKMPEKISENFRRILKPSVWVIALLLNTSIFTNLEIGISYDVLGEMMTIFVLAITLVMIGPEFRRTIQTYQNTESQSLGANSYLLTLVRIILALAPIILIILIALGYYYTALVLIEHLISSYFAFTTWLIIRNLIYRGFEVSSRRLAARRLKEKREQALAKANSVVAENSTDDFAIEVQQNDSLAISQVKDQVLRMVDFVLWIVLFGLFYFVWSDLITVAYYLNGVTLWQQSVTTETGVVMESVTLLNALVAVIILLVTYVLVRNIGGLLEVVVFSHIKLSQGTPYTVTTLLTYMIITLGAALAFGTLGMSWSKLQWLFAALSVGLGFGMQEIFANFVSGIIILFERPVRIGDTITIGTYSGTVSKIRIRATTLVDFDKKEVIVPNKAFVTERLVNWALSNAMTRLVISVGVAYGSDVELVKRLLLQAAVENERVLKDPAPMAYFLSFGASTLDHELRVYVGQLADRTRTIDELNRRINQLFTEHNIEIAFNQLDIFIKNQSTDEEIKLSSEKLALAN